MIRKIRVLIVDDSVVARKLLADALASDAAIEVVGSAPSGALALQKVPLLKPDVITLDVEMPEMSGLETLTALRKLDPGIPVIMFSSLTERGAASTLEAITRGAADYVTKPSSVGGTGSAADAIRAQLVPRIKAICGKRVGLTASTLPGAAALPALSSIAARIARVPPPRARDARIDIVAIGVSTGGPNALAELLPQLPADFPVPVVIVQHMPPVFTKHLAARLSTKCALRVVEATNDEPITEGKVWIAPGDHHLEVTRSGTSVRTRLHQGPQESSCRPAVDVLFRSVAAVYGAGTLAVVLTGMGYDGLKGCEAVRAAGGQIVVQDEASSVVWGMPGIVATSGLAERVLPLPELPLEILRRVNERRPSRHRIAV